MLFPAEGHNSVEFRLPSRNLHFELAMTRSHCTRTHPAMVVSLQGSQKKNGSVVRTKLFDQTKTFHLYNFKAKRIRDAYQLSIEPALIQRLGFLRSSSPRGSLSGLRLPLLPERSS